MSSLQSLAITALSSRYAPRGAERVEILPPREAERDAARRRDDGEGWSQWRDRRMAQRPAAPSIPSGFMAQFLAQHDPGKGAHVEDWRSARGAYARADRLSASGPRSVSIIL